MSDQIAVFFSREELEALVEDVEFVVEWNGDTTELETEALIKLKAALAQF